MPVRRATYPQVEPRAAGVMTRAIAVVPRTLCVHETARLARSRRARLVLARIGRGWGGATPELLERALALGLERAGLDALLWGAPAVTAETPEVTVRRRLGPATPFVAVVRAGQPVGAVLREPGPGGLPPRSMAVALAGLPGTGDVLKVAGRLGAELSWPVAVVGGVVRDLLLGRLSAPPRDLDVAVEGDASRLARRLASVLGGRVETHDAFLTATITLPDGRGVDLVTARRERYRQPGALPAVEPAALGDDLARRDFSINALAVRIDGPAWGQVLDPTGGLADLAGRRIRVLDSLSFVEDPTRIFRAARFAERLGFRLEASTRRLLAAAAALSVYRALSGDRLMAELEAILREPAPVAVLVRLGQAGALRLLLPGYRFRAGTRAALRRVEAALRTLPVARETASALALLALGSGLDEEQAEAWALRWGAPAPMRAAMARARTDAPGLARRLARAHPEEAYAALHGVAEPTAAWAWVLAGAGRTGRHVAAYLGRWRALPALLGGEDLKTLGLTPGPLFGRLLEDVRAAQVAGRLRSREEATAWAREAAGRIQRTGGAANGSHPESKGG